MTPQEKVDSGKSPLADRRELNTIPREKPCVFAESDEGRPELNGTNAQRSEEDGKESSGDRGDRDHDRNETSASTETAVSRSIQNYSASPRKRLCTSAEDTETKTDGDTTVLTDTDIISPPPTRLATPELSTVNSTPQTTPDQARKTSLVDSLSPTRSGGTLAFSPQQRDLPQSILRNMPHQSGLLADPTYRLAIQGSKTPSEAEKFWPRRQDASEEVWNEATAQRCHQIDNGFEEEDDDVEDELYEDPQTSMDINSWKSNISHTLPNRPSAPPSPPTDHEAFYRHRQEKLVKLQQFIGSRLLETNGEYTLELWPEMDAFAEEWAAGLGMISISAPEAEVRAARVAWWESMKRERTRLARELGMHLRQCEFLREELERVGQIAEEVRKKRLTITDAPENAPEEEKSDGEQQQPPSLVPLLRKMLEEKKYEIVALEAKIFSLEKERHHTEATNGSKFAFPPSSIDTRVWPLGEKLQKLQLYRDTLGQVLAGGDEGEAERLLGGGYQENITTALTAEEALVTEGRSRLEWAEVEVAAYESANSASQSNSRAEEDGGAEDLQAQIDVLQTKDTTPSTPRTSAGLDTDDDSRYSPQKVAALEARHAAEMANLKAQYEKEIEDLAEKYVRDLEVFQNETSHTHKLENTQLAANLKAFASVDESEMLRRIDAIRLEHETEKRKMSATYQQRLEVKDKQIRTLQEAANWENPEDDHGSCKAEIWAAKAKCQTDIQNMREKFDIQRSELEAELKMAKETLTDQKTGEDPWKRRRELLETELYIEMLARLDAKDGDIEKLRKEYEEKIERLVTDYDEEIDHYRERLDRFYNGGSTVSPSAVAAASRDTEVRVDDFERTIDDLHERIADLEADKAAAERSLEELQGKVQTPGHIPSLPTTNECEEHEQMIEEMAEEIEGLKKRLANCGGLLTVPGVALEPQVPGSLSSTKECTENEEVIEVLQEENRRLQRKLDAQAVADQTPGIIVTGPSPTSPLLRNDRTEHEQLIVAKDIGIEKLKHALAEQVAKNSQLQVRNSELEQVLADDEQEGEVASKEPVLSDLDFKRWLSRPMRLPVDDEDLAKQRSTDDQWIIKLFTQLHRKRARQIRELRAKLIEKKAMNSALKGLELREEAKEIAKSVEAVASANTEYETKLNELMSQEEALAKDRRAIEDEKTALKVLEMDLNNLKALVMTAIEPLPAKLEQVDNVIRTAQLKFCGRTYDDQRCASDLTISIDDKLVIEHHANPVFNNLAELTTQMTGPVIYAKESMERFWTKRETVPSIKELFGGVVMRDMKIKRLEKDLGELESSYVRFRERFGKLKDHLKLLNDAEPTTEIFRAKFTKTQQTAEELWVSEGEQETARREEQALSHTNELVAASEAVAFEYGQELATAMEFRTKYEDHKHRLEKRLRMMETFCEGYKAAKAKALSDVAKTREELRKLQLEMRERVDQLEKERDVAVLRGREPKSAKDLQTKLEAARMLEERRRRERDTARADADEARDKMNAAIQELLAYKAKRLDGEDPAYRLMQENKAAWKMEYLDKMSTHDDEKRELLQKIKDLKKEMELEKYKYKAIEDQASRAAKAEERITDIQIRLDKTRDTLQQTQDALQLARIQARDMEWKNLDEGNEEYLVHKELDEVKAKLEGERNLRRRQDEELLPLKRDLEFAKKQYQISQAELQKLTEEHLRLIESIGDGDASGRELGTELKDSIRKITTLELDMAWMRQRLAALEADKVHLVTERDRIERLYLGAVEMEKTTREMLNDDLVNREKLKKIIEHQAAVKEEQETLDKQKSGNFSLESCEGATSQKESSFSMQTAVRDLTSGLNEAISKFGPFEFLNTEADEPTVMDIEKLFERVHDFYVKKVPIKDLAKQDEYISVPSEEREQKDKEEEPLTRGDFNNFWMLFACHNLRLDVLRSVRDGAWALAYEKMERAMKHVNSIELGSFKVEVLGTLQYIQGYLDLLSSGNLEAAEAALARGRAYRPDWWTRSVWQDAGKRLTDDIEWERRRQASEATQRAMGDTSCNCKLRVMPCGEHFGQKQECRCYFHDFIELCGRHEKTLAHQINTSISQTDASSPKQPLVHQLIPLKSH